MVSMFHWVVLSCFLAGLAYSTDPIFHYTDFDDILTKLDEINQKCPDISSIYDLKNTSIQNRPLRVIVFGASPDKHEPGIPEFKYVGNMHGNEVVSLQVLLKLADYLCDGYDKDAALRDLIERTRIHILPTMNPDGYLKALAYFNKRGKNENVDGRTNAHGVDLNRNFPDLDALFFKNRKAAQNSDDPHDFRNDHLQILIGGKEISVEPETEAIMRWLDDAPFVASANLHGGDFVANYPWDDSVTHKTGYSRAPDDDTFIYLAESYAGLHPTMSDPDRAPCDRFEDSFEHDGIVGITNGAEWYPVAHGMQDYNYLGSNCMELTLELGCSKFPQEPTLPSYWEENKDSLVNLIKQVHIGIKGTVMNAENSLGISGARIIVKPKGGEVINHFVTSLGRQSEDPGEFYRLLIDGSYIVCATAVGYEADCENVLVGKYDEEDSAQLVSFALRPNGKAGVESTYDAVERALELLAYHGGEYFVDDTADFSGQIIRILSKLTKAD